MTENWKDIKGYIGLYQISDMGKVRDTNSQNLLSPFITKKGYHRYRLHRLKGSTVYTAHRLVAIAFLDNPNNKPFVHHKDHNPQNNQLSNLEWVTNKENLRYAREAGKFDNINHYSKLSETDVNEILSLLNVGIRQSDIARAKGICRQTIHKIKHGKAWLSVTGRKVKQKERLIKYSTLK